MRNVQCKYKTWKLPHWFHSSSGIVERRPEMLAKTLLLILSTHCLLISAESTSPTAAEVSEKCRNQHNLTEEEVKRLDESKFLNTTDDNVKCFVKCFYNEMKLMDEKGEFTLEASDWDSNVKRHFAACRNVTGTDSCDKAVNFGNCLGRELKQE